MDYEKSNNVPTKGARDLPSATALAMGFDAARRIMDRADVKVMGGAEFAELVIRLGYVFETVLDERN